jgi:hypothetical protein
MAAAAEVVERSTSYGTQEPPFYEWRVKLLEYVTEGGSKKTFGLTILSKTFENAKTCAIRWLKAEELRHRDKGADVFGRPMRSSVFMEFVEASAFKGNIDEAVMAMCGVILNQEMWMKEARRVETGYFVIVETKPDTLFCNAAEQKEQDPKK